MPLILRHILKKFQKTFFLAIELPSRICNYYVNALRHYLDAMYLTQPPRFCLSVNTLLIRHAIQINIYIHYL